MSIKEKEKALVKLIGRSALENSIEIDMDLYHWDRAGAIECAALRHNIEKDWAEFWLGKNSLTARSV